MSGDIMKWLSLIGLLVFVYLVVSNGNNTTQVINALSKAQSNSILALQGRNPQ